MPSSDIYLNTAAFGLIDPAVKSIADEFYTRLALNGSSVAENWRMNTDPEIRKSIADFLGANVSGVAMLPNFSWSMNAVVQSLTGKEKILLYKDDFPSLLEPFRMNGFGIHWVDAKDHFELPLEEIADLIRKREVDIVALSHVQYNSGYKLPIAEIGRLCHEHGVWFIVDATQSLGAIPINVSEPGVDVLIASNYKWMNAGFGTGIMYISDSFLSKYPPVVGGFNSFTMQDGAWHHTPSARSYEPGHPNMYGLTLLDASIEKIQSIGVANIEAHNAVLTRQLLESIEQAGLPLIGTASTDNRASFVLLWDKDGLSERIRKGGFVVTNRGGRIRISMHHYNTAQDVEAFAAYMEETATTS